MKKMYCTIATIAIIVSILGAIVFSACSKDGNEINSNSPSSGTKNSNELISYTGETFFENPNYTNEYENIGIYHNYLMDCISHEWLNDDVETTETDFLDFVANRFQQIDGYSTIINYDAIINEIRTSLFQNSSEEYSAENPDDLLVEELLAGGDYDSFLADIDDCINNSLDTTELMHNFDVIAQKVSNSTYTDDVKEMYLIYCAVSKYSVMNVVHICMDPTSGFYQYLFSDNDSKESVLSKVRKTLKEHPIAAADARGAVIGGATCARYGVAGGPAGVAVTTVAGAAVRGACSSAMKAARNEIINQIRN